MPEINGKPAEYCGDGVYAIFDGYGVLLLANSHIDPTDRIYLEPSVLKAVNNFFVRCHSKKEQGDENGGCG